MIYGVQWNTHTHIWRERESSTTQVLHNNYATYATIRIESDAMLDNHLRFYI